MAARAILTSVSASCHLRSPAVPQPKKSLLFFFRWLLLLPIPVVWCVLDQKEYLDFFENWTIDWRFQVRGEMPSPLKVVYVDVDSRSLQEIGNFPWSRHYFARVADALIRYGGVKAVGFDFLLSPAGQPELSDPKKLAEGDREIAQFLFKGPPVVFAASFVAREFRAAEGKVLRRELPLVASETRPLGQIEPPELTQFAMGRSRFQSPPNLGLIDTIDGGTRAVPVWTPTNTITFYHLSVQLARLYWGLSPQALQLTDDTLDFVNPDGSLRASIPLRDRQLLDVNWFSTWVSPQNPRISFYEAYVYADMLRSGTEEERKVARDFFAQDDFKDAVVLIGPTDPLLQDIAPTSLDDREPVPRVGIHGNLLKTIVSGQFLHRLEEKHNYAVVFGLTLIVAILALAGGSRALFAKIMAVLGMAIYVVLAFNVFKSTNLILPLTAPLGAALTTSFAGLIWQVIEEQKAKGRIKGMFGAYVSPELVNRMIESHEDPQLGGHDAEITAYFSDIQSFSAFSEKLASGPLVELMNEYLTACTDIVQGEGGTLDKYIGDAVVAMFGAPVVDRQHAYRACVATQLIQQKLGELRGKWKGEGGKWPEIVWSMQSRIGLNTGVCMIGNMGSRTRFNYTMMGDNVNLAARMESGAKSWGAYTMCAESTKLTCEQQGDGRVIFRPLGKIVVMGRSAPVPIFEIVGLKETIAPQTPECIGLFQQALTRHDERDWDGALALFQQSARLESNQPGITPGVKTNPSLVYFDIIEGYKLEPPPPDWDGVYVMKEK